MIEPTDEMIADATQALNDHGVRGVVAAVLAIAERDRCLERKGHVWHPLAKPVESGPCSASLPHFLDEVMTTACELRHGHTGDHQADNGLTRWREL